jgi:hypothetical protein
MFNKIYLNGDYTVIQLMNIIKEQLHILYKQPILQNELINCHIDQKHIICTQKTNTLTF